MIRKIVLYSVSVIILAGFVNQGICQSETSSKKYSLNLDGGTYICVNKKIFGGVIGLNLQSKNHRFGLNARLKYQDFYQTKPFDLFAHSWYIGFAEINYRIEKIKKFPFKISLGLGPVSEDIYLFNIDNPYLDLGYIITTSIQKEINNFEFEFRLDTHTCNFFRPNFPSSVCVNYGNIFGWRFNFTFGAIYRLKVFEF